MALGFISLLLYQAWVIDYSPQPEPVAEVSGGGSGMPASADAGDLPAVPSQMAETAVSETGVETAGARNIEIRTNVMEATISTAGGTLNGLRLIKYPVSVDEPDTPFTLLSDIPEQYMIAQSGLQGTGDSDTPTHKALWQGAETRYVMGEGVDTLAVPLVWQNGGGVTVTKTFTFRRDSYEVNVDYQIDNQSDLPFAVSQYYQIQRQPPRKSKARQMTAGSYTGGVISTEEERYQKIDFGDMQDENLSVETQGGWVAMIQHYFASAWVPPAENKSTFYSIHLDNQNRYIIGTNSDLITVAPGASQALGASAYIGPKVQEWLGETAPHLELTVDFGWLTILAQPLFWLLKNIHAMIGNWGWAIIFLTCIVKAIFYPLSQASYKSMARMKKLQPQLQALKERYGDDRQRMGQATMELYKKEKVNPLGGCLPMIIQIPVFIALYWMLLESVELRQAPWMFWIRDLSIKDPFFVLPVIMGVTMFIQQKLNPAPVDPIQAKVFMALPFVFTVFFAFFPAGLVLYWIVNNTLSIAQQYYITRHVIGDK